VNWKRSIGRNLLFAVLGGVVANAIYWGLLYTTALHGFAAGALGPANNFVWRLDQNCYTPLRCDLEMLAANVILYAFWIFVALIGIDALRQLKQKLTR
jgi:hypothetical protein